MFIVPVYVPSRSELHIEAVFKKFNRKGGWWEFYREIAKKYAVPERFYHTFSGHIEACLAEFRWMGKHAENPEAVAIALVLHDVVMDFQRSDNEEKSAEYAREILARMNVSREFADEVANLILATKHDALPQSEDAKLVVDIDLAILGKNRWRFNHYDRQIRQEYAFVPEEIFRKKRAEIMQKFLDRPSIFVTDHFRQKYEAQARKNLEALIKKLSA